MTFADERDAAAEAMVKSNNACVVTDIDECARGCFKSGADWALTSAVVRELVKALCSSDSQAINRAVLAYQAATGSDGEGK